MALIVPLKASQMYVEREIKADTAGPLIPVIPAWLKEQPENEYINRIFYLMEQVRENSEVPLFSIGDGQSIDIGMLDVIVQFDAPQEHIKALLSQNSKQLLSGNSEHIDMLLENSLHDQMVFVQALHAYNARGEFCLHYHNIFFGLRMDGEKIGALDFTPFLNELDIYLGISNLD